MPASPETLSSSLSSGSPISRAGAGDDCSVSPAFLLRIFSAAAAGGTGGWMNSDPGISRASRVVSEQSLGRVIHHRSRLGALHAPLDNRHLQVLSHLPNGKPPSENLLVTTNP